MKKIYYLFLLAFLGVGIVACDNNDENTLPGAVKNIIAIPGAGFITLQWELPDGEHNNSGAAAITHVKLSYTDPATRQEVNALVNILNNKITVNHTLEKYGKYTFYIQPVSIDGVAGNVQTIESVSEAAPLYPEYETPVKLALTTTNLTTNAQETSEGPITALFDDDPNSHFHSSYNRGIGAYHYLQVDFQKNINFFKYESLARSNNNNIPSDIDFEGSTDGVTFKSIANINLGKEIITAPQYYASDMIGTFDFSFRYVRYIVKGTNTGQTESSGKPFFTMAEFKIYEVPARMVDPEKE